MPRRNGPGLPDAYGDLIVLEQARQIPEYLITRIGRRTQHLISRFARAISEQKTKENLCATMLVYHDR